MRILVIAGLCSAFAGTVWSAMAQTPAATTAAPLKLEGSLVVSADGRRVGRVKTIEGQRDAPVSVTVIKDNRFATIPANTLPAGDNGRVLTSLKYRDIH